MNILIVTDAVFPFSMGGSHRLIYEDALELVRLGHSVTVVVPEMVGEQHSAHDGSKWADRSQFRIVRFPIDRTGMARFGLPLFTAYAEPVRQLLAAERFDVINVHYLPALFAIRNVTDQPIAFNFHGPWSGELTISLDGRFESAGGFKAAIGRPLLRALVGPLTHWLERLTFRRCKAFATESAYMRDKLVAEFGIKRDAITVIPAGVNATDFYPEKDPAVRSRLRANAKTVLLTVRRLEKRMGLDNLIRAAAILRRTHPDFRLLIGGKGNQMSLLQSMIEEHDLASHVELLGFIPEGALRKYLTESDVFVLPSRDLEGFGLVVLESMACGTPVLVSPHGGAKEIVRDADPRLVLPSIEPKDIAARLATLIDAGVLHDSAVRAASLGIANGFSWRLSAERTADWLTQLRVEPSAVLAPELHGSLA